MTHKTAITPPIFPPFPREVTEHSLRYWYESLMKELSRVIDDFEHALMSSTGKARIVALVLGSGFTIDDDGLILLLDCAGAVTSDVTTAIADGQLGDRRVLVNISANNITIKNNANTKLGADLVMATLTAYQVVWSGSDWIRVQ